MLLCLVVCFSFICLAHMYCCGCVVVALCARPCFMLFDVDVIVLVCGLLVFLLVV